MFCHNCGAKTAQQPTAQRPNPPQPLGAPQQPVTPHQPGTPGNTVYNALGTATNVFNNAETATGFHIQRIIIAVLAIIGVISIFLPWITLMGNKVNGFNTDGLGIFILVFFLLSLGACFLGNRKKPLGKIAIATAIFGAISAAFVLNNIIGANAELRNARGYVSRSMISLGFGIHLAAFVGINIFIVSILGFFIFKKK